MAWEARSGLKLLFLPQSHHQLQLAKWPGKPVWV